jgi:hypothetical protein
MCPAFGTNHEYAVWYPLVEPRSVPSCIDNEQDNWWPGSCLKVVEPNSLYRHETAAGRMSALRLFNSIEAIEGHRRHCGQRHRSA